MELKSEIILLLVGATIALFSAVLTNYFSYKNQIITQKNQFEHDVFQSNKKRKIEVAEELHSLFSRWNMYVLTSHMSLTLVMEGRKDYNWYLDNLIEAGETADIDSDRIELLFQAYFPAIDHLRKKVSEALSDHNLVINAHKQAYKKGEQGINFIRHFNLTQIEFDNACKSVKSALIDELRKLDTLKG